MGTYILRRLLYMIPTLFAISLIVFIIINLAPGTPGAAKAAGTEGQETASEGQSKREAYKLFKQQFNLDKPVLFNFRYLDMQNEIETYLGQIQRQLYIFSVDEKYIKNLDNRLITKDFIKSINKNNIVFSEDISIRTKEKGKKWTINDKNLIFEFNLKEFAKELEAKKIPEELEEEFKNNGYILSVKVEIILDDNNKNLYLKDFEKNNLFLLDIKGNRIYKESKNSFLAKYEKDKINFYQCNIPLKDIIKAEETLENYGIYSIPAIIKVINKSYNKDIRDLAVKKFCENAKGKVFTAYYKIDGKKAEKFLKEFDNKISKGDIKVKFYKKEALTYVNQKILSENNKIDRFFYVSKDKEEKKQRNIAKINKWHTDNKYLFEFSTFDKILISLFDTRFACYWENLFHLDFGIAHVTKRPVLDTVSEKIKYSLSLAFVSLILAYLIAVPLGILCAVKQNKPTDVVITVFLFMLYALPNFFVASLLLQYLSIGGDGFHWFPTGGFQSKAADGLTTIGQLKDIIWHIVLPVACLTYVGLASLSRYARTGLLDVIRADYIKTARAKGLPEYIVILRHAVRNGMIPILTLLASILPVLIGGSIIIEVIFGIDGMGQLAYSAITMRDYNTIMCTSLISAVLVMFGVLLSDITYALVDPRISFK